jgi:hypothetical protein
MLQCEWITHSNYLSFKPYISICRCLTLVENFDTFKQQSRWCQTFSFQVHLFLHLFKIQHWCIAWTILSKLCFKSSLCEGTSFNMRLSQLRVIYQKSLHEWFIQIVGLVNGSEIMFCSAYLFIQKSVDVILVLFTIVWLVKNQHLYPFF